MIAFIRGELVAIEEEKAIVDVQGVGYGIFMPAHALNQLPHIGTEVKLHTYLNVREDAMQLFGFLTPDDLFVYKLVISVSGIGPKGGLAILSTLTPNDLRFAVAASDVKAISAAPGIGKKTAEKLIIELKDKLSIEDALPTEEAGNVNASAVIQGNDSKTEAAQALVALGYDMTSSMKAVRKVVDVDGTMSVEELLKEALKYMMF